VTVTDIRASVLDALTEVAPEIDPAALDHARPLRDQVELDSMDFLFFLTSLADRTGVEVAEGDYDQVRSLDDLVGYVRDRGAAS
jgi:acyl carrier protein